jgi:uncharacterized SAM-binding protein YcdF (DUF218 family)
VLVRVRPEVQAVPRPLSTRAIGGDLRLITVVGLVAITLVVGYAVARIWDQGSRSDDRTAGAIVVMGAAQYDGQPSPVFRARLDHAIELWQAGRAPLLVMTGGKREGDRTTESAAGRTYALAHGVPSEDIVEEPLGRTTEESIDRVSRLLTVRGIDAAVFVSDPTHMLRVLRMATDHGIEAIGSPTRTSPVEANPSRWLDATAHEVGALALYFLSGDRSDQSAPTE